MINLEHFFEGYILGVSVGTSIGISGILCLQNMMSGRASLGLVSVFAAAFADMTCSVLALFGMQFLENFFISYQKGLSITAAVLLCFLGLNKLFGTMSFVPTHQPSHRLLAAFGTIYFLGIIDPVSVLDFIALSLGLVLDFSVTYNIIQFIAGIFLGSFSWWITLFLMIFMFKKGIPVKYFEYIQYVIGTIILSIGLWTLWIALA